MENSELEEQNTMCCMQTTNQTTPPPAPPGNLFICSPPTPPVSLLLSPSVCFHDRTTSTLPSTVHPVVAALPEKKRRSFQGQCLGKEKKNGCYGNSNKDRWRLLRWWMRWPDSWVPALEACVGVATCDTKSSDQLNLTPTSWNSLGPGLPPALPNHNNFFSHRRWWITSLFSKIHL